MKQLASILVFFLLSTTGVVAGEETYDEPLLATDAFQRAWEALDWESAFYALKPSELSANSHPADLMTLAEMYRDGDFTILGTKRERAIKFWELSERAALTGYEPAVIQLANAFDWGDEILGYESDDESSDCLNSIIDKRVYVSPDKDWLDKKMVKDCLLIPSSPAPKNHKESGPTR